MLPIALTSTKWLSLTEPLFLYRCWELECRTRDQIQVDVS